MMFRMFRRSRNASVHCVARDDCAGTGASAIDCCWAGASRGEGSGGGGGGSALARGETGTECDGRGGGAAGCAFRPIFSTTRRISSALTFRAGGIDTGADGGVGRRIMGGTARGTRGVGTVTGRGCGRGIAGFGGTRGGASSSDSGELRSWDCCSLLQPLARLTTTKIITQMRPPMSASLIMLAGWPGLTDILSRD
jgi:hypothetical protein